MKKIDYGKKNLHFSGILDLTLRKMSIEKKNESHLGRIRQN